ncbi:MAG: hypothetical protein ACREQX_16730, partial [Candidatus Binataceae bacterium]
DHGDLIGFDDPFKYGTPRWFSESTHHGIDGGGLRHADSLVFTNELVKHNLSRQGARVWSRASLVR